MPFSNQDDQEEKLGQKTRAYAELFQALLTQDAEQIINPAPAELEAKSLAIVLREEQDQTLPFMDLAKNNALIAGALGIAGAEIPRLFFSDEEAHRFAAYVGKHIKELKAYLPEEPAARKNILEEVNKMMRESIESRHRDVLLRWFRDPAAAADLNPGQVINRKSPAKGNVLQLIHPLLFNAILLAVSLATVILIFAYKFKEGV